MTGTVTGGELFVVLVPDDGADLQDDQSELSY